MDFFLILAISNTHTNDTLKIRPHYITITQFIFSSVLTKQFHATTMENGIDRLGTLVCNAVYQLSPPIAVLTPVVVVVWRQPVC